MGIAQKVARNFSDAVRSRGQSYFVKGRVTVMAARPGEVVAKVRGTSKYRVRLRLRGSKLLASCTCPYFSPQGEPCKHLWATLLLADSRNLLQSPPVFPSGSSSRARAGRRRRGLPEVRDDATKRGRAAAVSVRFRAGDHRAGAAAACRPAAARVAGHPAADKDRGVRGEPMGDPGTWSQRGPSPRDHRASSSRPVRRGPRRRAGCRRRAPGRRPRPSIAMPSGCWSTCWTSPPRSRRTRWSSTWPAASARRPASGDRFGPGTTPPTPLTSSTTPKIG